MARSGMLPGGMQSDFLSGRSQGSPWGGGGTFGFGGGMGMGGGRGLTRASGGMGGYGAAGAGAGSSGYSPDPFHVDVQENPQLAALRGEYSRYQHDLAGNQDADARNAMGRQRDVASGMAKEGMGMALDKGFGSNSGFAQRLGRRSLEAGQKATAELSTGLTSDARRAQLSVLQGRTGLEGTQAGITQGQQDFALRSWQAQQQARQAAASLGLQQQQAGFSQQMALLGGMGGFYTGF